MSHNSHFARSLRSQSKGTLLTSDAISVKSRPDNFVSNSHNMLHQQGTHSPGTKVMKRAQEKHRAQVMAKLHSKMQARKKA